MQVIYSLQVGGSEKLALEISSHLDLKQFKPSVCALDLGGELAKDLEKNNIDYHVLHRRGVELNILRKLYRVIKRGRVDVVHTHHFTQLFYTAVPARLAGARIIHTEHEFFSYMSSKLSRTMILPLSRLCDRITVVGPEVADYFVRTLGIPERNVVIVPNGVDTTKFDCDRKAVREELGLSPEEAVIGTVGRLEPEKDQRTLLDAVLQVKGECPNVRLVIVGDGRLADELRAYAKHIGVFSQTLFLGTRRDIPKLLAAMDVFVLSSVREGLPIALIEAMAAKRPVVASDIGSIRALVRDGHNGFLVPSGDAAAFGRGLRRLLKSSELQEHLGEAGRRTVEASFSLATMIRAYEGLYQSTIRKPHVWN
ncbi:MAG: glycosyltransferase [Nitrospira sp.]|nr:glycosyltransferase [Nitrospira sp.]